MVRRWVDVFEDLDQWDVVERFYAVHARGLNTKNGSKRICSPEVAYLVALCSGLVQLVHHVHLEPSDDFLYDSYDPDDEGQIWALTDAGGTASMVVINPRSAYARRKKASRTTGGPWRNGRRAVTSPIRRTTSETQLGRRRLPQANLKQRLAKERHGRSSPQGLGHSARRRLRRR
jgi:hypothetical protein